MQRDVERVEELYLAFSRRDLEGILLLMAKDVEIVQSTELPWGGAYRGHEGVREFIGKLGACLDNRLHIECLIDAGDHVVAVGRSAGQAKATGLEFDVPFVHVWTVHDGQVTRFQPYVENATLLAALTP